MDEGDGSESMTSGRMHTREARIKEKWKLRGFQSSAIFFGGPEFGRSYIRTSRRRPPLMVSANLDPKLS